MDESLKRGLRLKKVQRVIKFKQRYWMKPYIMLNTKLKITAKNEFGKECFRLMNNSVFGNSLTLAHYPLTSR